MSDKPCFICRGRSVFAIAVQVGEDAEFLHVYKVDVCGACFSFHKEIADRIHQYIADHQHEDGSGEEASR
jgi:hypothetical protein